MRSTTLTLILGATLLSTAMTAHPAAAAAQGTVDPCTFFSKAEIEKAFGWSYGPPKKGSTFLGPTCMFYSVNTGTISIRAGEPQRRAQFDSLPMMIPDATERVSGIGESAFFYRGALYVLNNGHQLVVSVSGETTPQVRAALLTLGRLGAPRLRR